MKRNLYKRRPPLQYTKTKDSLAFSNLHLTYNINESDETSLIDLKHSLIKEEKKYSELF